jgi:hypothetical protein
MLRASIEASGATADLQGVLDRTIDTENILDLVIGRPRILMLRQVPFRIRIEDPAVAVDADDDGGTEPRAGAGI